jgi:hemin uptake protein HemP
MSFIGTLSLRVPVRSPTLFGLDFPLTTIVGIAGKRKQFLNCTQKTTRAKLERLRSAGLIQGDQKIIFRHTKASTRLKDS